MKLRMKEDHGFHCDINNYNEAFSLVKKKKGNLSLMLYKERDLVHRYLNLEKKIIFINKFEIKYPKFNVIKFLEFALIPDRKFKSTIKITS